MVAHGYGWDQMVLSPSGEFLGVFLSSAWKRAILYGSSRIKQRATFLPLNPLSTSAA